MFYRLKTDFRLSIITLLAISAILGISPFAVMRFLQGNVLAGVVDLSIMLAITAGTLYAWVTGDTARSGFFMALVAGGGAVAVGAFVGEPGLFWLYPCLVTSFFLTEPRYAIFINLAAVIALMVHGGAFSSSIQMWSFAATTVVVSCCAYAFAHRNENQRERLEHLATIDPLTGIKNRRSMDEELAMAVASAARTGIPYGLVLLDIDHFKKVNDEYGLRAVMHNLQHIMSKFLKHPGGKVTASFGVAVLKIGESPDNWLARADEALYKAKASGRDQIVYADDVVAAAETA